MSVLLAGRVRAAGRRKLKESVVYAAVRATATNTNIVMPRPAGTVAGDLIIFIIQHASTTSWRTDAGAAPQFTFLHHSTTDPCTAIVYKIAGASEPTSYTFYWNGSGSVYMGGYGIGIRDVDTAQPIEAHAWTTGATAPSVSTAKAGNRLVCLFGTDHGGSSSSAYDYAAPSGMDEHTDSNGLTTAISGAVFSETLKVTGSTGGRTTTRGSKAYSVLVNTAA